MFEFCDDDIVKGVREAVLVTVVNDGVVEFEFVTLIHGDDVDVVKFVDCVFVLLKVVVLLLFTFRLFELLLLLLIFMFWLLELVVS